MPHWEPAALHGHSVTRERRRRGRRSPGLDHAGGPAPLRGGLRGAGGGSVRAAALRLDLSVRLPAGPPLQDTDTEAPSAGVGPVLQVRRPGRSGAHDPLPVGDQQLLQTVPRRRPGGSVALETPPTRSATARDRLVLLAEDRDTCRFPCLDGCHQATVLPYRLPPGGGVRAAGPGEPLQDGGGPGKVYRLREVQGCLPGGHQHQ